MKRIQHLSVEIRRDSGEEKAKKVKEIMKLRNDNYALNLFLKNKISNAKLEKYPQELDYYLASREEKISKLAEEIEEIEKEIENLTEAELEEKLQRKSNLEMKKKELEKELGKDNFLKNYLGYISNNERL